MEIHKLWFYAIKIGTKKSRLFLVYRQYIVVHDTKKVLEAGMEFVANVTNGICVLYFSTSISDISAVITRDAEVHARQPFSFGWLIPN